MYDLVDVDVLIEKLVNQIIDRLKRYEDLRRMHNVDKDVADWSKVKCIDVAFKLCIYIENASPEAYNFKNYIYEKLHELGVAVSNVEIITEM